MGGIDPRRLASPTPVDVAWPIVHVDLRAAGQELRLPARQPGAGLMLVYWKGDRPVGHRIIEGDAAWPDAEQVMVWGETLLAASPPDPVGGSDQDLRLSVVVPTCDRPEELSRCLEALRGQARPANEVIVVDNSRAGSASAAVASMPGVRYVHEERRGLDFARNAGVLASTGDIIAFSDDDVTVHRTWCGLIRAAFDSPEVMALTGLVLPAELSSQAQRLFEFDWGFGRGYRRIDFGPPFMQQTISRGCPVWKVGAGASMAFRREAFEKVGLFDVRLDAGAAGCSGDSEMWYRLLAEGWICRYEPSVVSFHRHRHSMEALRGQIRAYMRGHVTALLIQYERYGHLGNLVRAFWTLPRNHAFLLARSWLRGRGEEDLLLRDRILGCLSGYLYYMRNCRPRYEAVPPAGKPD